MKFILKRTEDILLFIVIILSIPIIPFAILLNKVHEKIHENDPWIY
jgi:hypothetical protein